jgi:hypothetical protein
VVYFPYKTAIEDVNLPQWMKYYGCKIAIEDVNYYIG